MERSGAEGGAGGDNQPTGDPPTNGGLTKLHKRVIILGLECNPMSECNIRIDLLNGKWIAFTVYSAFIQSALQYCLTFTHSYTDGGANHAR